MMRSLIGVQNTRMFASAVGDKIPHALVSVVKYDSEKDEFVNDVVDTCDYFKGKKIALVGYPGAYTPTCMATHIPEYIGLAESIKAAGADEIIALSVNDPFVVKHFAATLGSKGLINYMADGNGELTKALDLEVDLSAH